MKFEWKEHKVQLNELSLNYIDFGKGDVLLFLHNGGGFWQTWINQISYFSNKYRVIALDWPGFGGSSEHKDGLSILSMYKTLKEFVLKLNLKAITLVGNCIGGSVALLYAQKNHEFVKYLVILNICPGEKLFPNKAISSIITGIGSSRMGGSILSAILRYLFTKTAIKNKFPAILFSPGFPTSDPLFNHYIEKFKEPRQTRSRIGLLYNVSSYTTERIFKAKKTNTKCLLIWGSDNQVTRLNPHGLQQNKIINPERFEIVQHAGHLCAYEQPAIVNRLIEAYIR